MSENTCFFWPDPSTLSNLSEDLFDFNIEAMQSLEGDHLSETSLLSQSKKIHKKQVLARSPSIQSHHSSSTNSTNKASKEIAKGIWHVDEDAKVIELYNVYGPKWAKIASIMKTRTRKQIRDRYLNLLRPDINYDDWTREEEELLAMLHEKYGNKWSKIAAEIPRRTENQIKNKFYYSVKKALSPKALSKIPEQEQSGNLVSLQEMQESVEAHSTDSFFFPLKEAELSFYAFNTAFKDSFNDIGFGNY